MPYLISVCVGVFSVAFLPFLGSLLLYLTLTASLYGILLVFSDLLLVRKPYPQKIGAVLICFILGQLWGVANGQKLLASQLSHKWDKKQFIVVGDIVGLVDTQAHRSRFQLEVSSILPAQLNSATSSHNHLRLNKLLLSWYGDQQGIPLLKAGDSWQFVVKLRRPRGLLNPGGFDYEAWLIENGFSATGYIVRSSLNQPAIKSLCLFGCQFRRTISRVRDQLRTAIYNTELSPRNQAFITALTVGDKGNLRHWWDDLTRFGIVHLMVISGLHIGLMAGFGFWFGSLLLRLLVAFCGWLPAGFNSFRLIHYTPAFCALFFATVYSLLAGFSLPTQRALIVVLLVMLAKVFYRRLAPHIIFIWSLFLIAIFQPLAVIGASFWLSFSAVAVLLMFFSPRVFVSSVSYRMFSGQWILFIGMAGPLMLFIGKISWLGLLINLIAVPVISLVTVPLCLLAGMVFLIAPSLSSVLWQLAGYSTSSLWFILNWLPDNWGFLWFSIPQSGLLLLSLCVAFFYFVLPRGLWGRYLLLLPLVLLLLHHKPRPPLRLTVLDVGQGLAVIIETQSKSVVYDTGPAYSEQFNSGSAVIAPYLRARGIKAVDKLVVSHGDMDHSGGINGLVSAYTIKETLLAPGYFREVNKTPQPVMNIKSCENSKRWAWSFDNPLVGSKEWIYFDVLMPVLGTPEELIPDDNNSSCVLLIRWGDQHILLAGDIEKSAESSFLRHYQLEPITVLVAPHHGSKTSSSQPFISSLKPQHVVFSAGYRHYFGHPHKSVVARYTAAGAQLWNTADNGGIVFEWDETMALNVTTTRGSAHNYWWR